MTQLHLLARFDGESGHFLSGNLGHKFGDTARDLDSVFVKLVLPEEAGEDRSAEL